MSSSWRANAFRTTTGTGSPAAAGDSPTWRKPALRDVGTVVAVLAVPVVLGGVGLVLAAFSRWF
jgi:hypothetical protein